MTSPTRASSERPTATRRHASPRALALALLACLPLVTGCANFIKEESDTVLDVVEGTAKAGFDEQSLEGALFQGKIRFTCQERLFNVTNIYETPYRAPDELYEVPVGLVSIIPAFLWYGITTLATIGAAERSGAVGPIHWASAGLNPFLNVENGMFAERYRIRLKPGSKRPDESSRPRPYSAVLPPESPVAVSFEGGEAVPVAMPRDTVGLTINLLELARVIPSPESQRILVDVSLVWNVEADPIARQLDIYITADLARTLWKLRDASRTVFDPEASPQAKDGALSEMAQAGFSAEAARLRDVLRSAPQEEE